MKKLSTIFIALFFFSTAIACNAGNSSRLSDTRFKDKRSVGSFSSIDISGAIDVKVYIGSETSVEVIANDNLLSRVKTEVNGSTLEIGIKGKENFNGKVQVIVYTPELVSAEVSGASKLFVSNLNNSSFTLDVSGASIVKIEGSTNNLTLDVSGASDINLSNFTASNATGDFSGASHGVLNVQNNLTIEASGASYIKYYGNPELKSDISGASNIKSIN
jgi:hypothetical protein